MLKKVRIQQFDPKTHELVQDKCVTQNPEFWQGPKEKVKGPIRIEFTIEDQEDLAKVKTYLDQLKGDIPLKKKNNTIVKKAPSQDVLVDQREELLKEIKEKKSKSQETLIKFLREYGFVFMYEDRIEDLNLGIKLKKVHQGKYQWMVRCIKRAKDPKSDRFDPMLAFGIKVFEEDSDKVIVYHNREFEGKYDIPKESSGITLKQQEMLKFPPYMIQEERDKFRKEYRYHKEDPEKPKSKFYKRWENDVEIVVK